MVFYVTVMVFILPTCILTPIFLKISSMNSQCALRKDISSDFLDQVDDNDENEEEVLEDPEIPINNPEIPIHHPEIPINDPETPELRSEYKRHCLRLR